MIVNDLSGPETPNAEAPRQPVARKNRGVRFSDPEWEEVNQAAQDHGLTPAEFVRAKILELVRGPSSSVSAVFPTHLIPLIGRTFRYTWMPATHKRNELIQAGGGGEMEKLVEAARELQEQLQAPRE